MTYTQIIKEMADLGYDPKGARFINPDGKIISYHNGYQEVTKVSVKTNYPSLIAYFADCEEWEIISQDDNEVIFRITL